MLSTIGLGVGTLLAFLATLTVGHRKKGLLITLAFWPWVFLYAGVYELLEYLNNSSNLESVVTAALLAFMFSIAAASSFLIKHLQIAIDEWEYIAHLSVLMFVISHLYGWWWMILLIPFGLVSVLPLLISGVLSKAAKIYYYVSYSAMSVLIFSLLIGFGIFDAIAADTNYFTTFLQATAIGWVLYIYLVHGIILLMLTDHGTWKKLGDIHVHFNLTRRYPTISLVTLFTVCIGSLWVLTLQTTLLNAVVIVSVSLSALSYFVHWYFGQQYFFTQKNVLHK